MPKLIALLLASLVILAPVQAEEIRQLSASDGHTTPYLLSADLPDKTAPAAVAILFNGGEGNVGLVSKGIPHPGTNFLVRSRGLFVAHGVPVAVIDTPSDRSGMPDSYRMSQRHADDVSALITAMQQQFPASRVYLIGTSRGTVSAAYAGAALGNKVAGVVLSSSVFNASRDNNGLAGFSFSRISAPLLLVHHVDDGCPASPYGPAQRLASEYPLLTVHGGKPATSGPCEPFSPHGYLGREEAVVDAITNWMLGRAYPRELD